MTKSPNEAFLRMFPRR